MAVTSDVQFSGGISHPSTTSTSSVNGAGDETSELLSASATFDSATLAADGGVHTSFSAQDLVGNIDYFAMTAAVLEPGLGPCWGGDELSVGSVAVGFSHQRTLRSSPKR